MVLVVCRHGFLGGGLKACGERVGFSGLLLGLGWGLETLGGMRIGGKGGGGGYVVKYEWIGGFYACMDFRTQLCVAGLWGGAKGEMALLAV